MSESSKTRVTGRLTDLLRALLRLCGHVVCVRAISLQAAATITRAYGPHDTVRTLEAVGETAASTTTSLNEANARIRCIDSSVDAGLAKLGCSDSTLGLPSSSSNTKADKEEEEEEEDDEADMRNLLPHLCAHRIRCAEQCLALLETLRTDLSGIDVEARGRAEEARERHNAEVVRAVQGRGGGNLMVSKR